MAPKPHPYDFNGPCAHTYEEACPACGTVNHVSTQQDHDSEYMTTVFVQCRKCEASVKFRLPVN